MARKSSTATRNDQDNSIGSQFKLSSTTKAIMGLQFDDVHRRAEYKKAMINAEWTQARNKRKQPRETNTAES